MLSFLADSVATQADGTKYWAIAIVAVVLGIIAVAEALIAVFSVNGMARNPEASKGLRTTMLIGMGLIESIAIYDLLIAIFLVFIAK